MEQTSLARRFQIVFALVLVAFSGLLFMHALFLGFGAQCFLGEGAPVLTATAARLGLSASVLFALPFVLLPLGAITAMATVAARKVSHILMLFILSVTAIATADHVMKLVVESHIGDDDLVEDCMD